MRAVGAEQEFQLQQMLDILREKMAKRSVDVAAMDVQEVNTSLNHASQKVLIKQVTCNGWHMKTN